jgi:hypothetical protein
MATITAIKSFIVQAPGVEHLTVPHSLGELKIRKFKTALQRTNALAYFIIALSREEKAF